MVCVASLHTISLAQRRSDVVDGATDSYWVVLLQVVRSEHTRSPCVVLPEMYCAPAVQTVYAVHTRSLVVVGSAEIKCVAMLQVARFWQTVCEVAVAAVSSNWLWKSHG